MNQETFELNGRPVTGVVVPLPKAPLVTVYGDGGFVMCGYLNVEVADKLGVAAAMVRGVSTVDDLLRALVQAVSQEGLKKGVSVGMTGKEALSRMVSR